MRGWTERTGARVEEAARRAIDAGIKTIVYTDIERDGMLTGPDLEGCQALIALGAEVIGQRRVHTHWSMSKPRVMPVVPGRSSAVAVREDDVAAGGDRSRDSVSGER